MYIIEIFRVIFIFLITFFLILKISKNFNVSKNRASLIFLLHTAICLLYVPLTISGQTDPYGYFKYSQINSYPFWGTGLVMNFTSIFSKYLDFGIYSCFLVFNFIGTTGLIILESTRKKLVVNSDKIMKTLSAAVLFLPTLHLNTSAPGKDVFCFLCINLVIYSLLQPRIKFFTLITSALIFSIIRPYIGMILMIGLAVAFLNKINMPKYYLLIIRIMMFILLFFVARQGLKILEGGYDYQTVIGIMEYNRTVTEVGNNSIDTSSYNIPLKLFTYMFRPLFFDARGLFPLLLSFDNLVLLLTFTYPFLRIMYQLKFRTLKLNATNYFLIIYSSLSWFFYAQSTSNLGLAARHKIMILPAIFCLSLFFSRKSKELVYKN